MCWHYDTLPLRVASEAELEPGDLIFWSGEYFNPKSRKQVFDMVHVEVFVGGPTGKGTIGSRQQYKWVMEYDSYEFTSKSWHCKEIFFCKLDTWLDGVLQPEHPELWKGTKAAPTLKRSLFHVQQQQHPEAPHEPAAAPPPRDGGRQGVDAEEDYELQGVAGSDTDADSDASEEEPAQTADEQCE